MENSTSLFVCMQLNLVLTIDLRQHEAIIKMRLIVIMRHFNWYMHDSIAKLPIAGIMKPIIISRFVITRVYCTVVFRLEKL